MKKLGLFVTFFGTFLLANLSQAVPIVFHTVQIPEFPANASPGIMNGSVSFDITTHEMIVDLVFSGLTAGNTASHIHCCTALPVLTNPTTPNAGVATTTPTFTGFPTGATSGTYHRVFDTSLAASWNGAFITAHGGTTAGAEADFLAGLQAGKTYWNVHTTAFPGGEIRAALIVPEPASLALLGLGLLGLGFSRRKNAA
jgi:hypothetical protein